MLHFLYNKSFCRLTHRRSPASQPPCSTPRRSSCSSHSSPPRLSSPPQKRSTASVEHTTPTAPTGPTSAAWPPSSRPRPPPPRASRRPVLWATGLTGCEPPPAASPLASALRPAPPASPAPSGRRRARARTAGRCSSWPATALSDSVAIFLDLSAWVRVGSLASLLEKMEALSIYMPQATTVGFASWVRRH
ncbi:hypothetical protein ACQJBY_038904 [Aegilops geniculata]